MIDDYATYNDFEREVIAEMKREELDRHPVLSEISVRRFVSRSAGRGRKRSRPVEVALVVRRRGGATSWHKFPLDQLSESLDGDFHYSESELVDILLDGKSEPEL